MSTDVVELQQRAEKAEAFKKWVHDYLDSKGVPHDPDPEHTKETGCRISGRLKYLHDLYLQQFEVAQGLRRAIREHRDVRGDDRCYLDDSVLYSVLPEGDTRTGREVAVTIENCRRFIECRNSHLEYVSPQRRIEELEEEVCRLKAMYLAACQRVADQSELLSKRAEK